MNKFTEGFNAGIEAAIQAVLNSDEGASLLEIVDNIKTVDEQIGADSK